MIRIVHNLCDYIQLLVEDCVAHDTVRLFSLALTAEPAILALFIL